MSKIPKVQNLKYNSRQTIFWREGIAYPLSIQKFLVQHPFLKMRKNKILPPNKPEKPLKVISTFKGKFGKHNDTNMC